MIQQQGRLYMKEGNAFTPAPFPASMLLPCPFQLPALSQSHNNPLFFPSTPEQMPQLEVENGQIQGALKVQKRLQCVRRRWGLAETYFQETNFEWGVGYTCEKGKVRDRALLFK